MFSTVEDVRKLLSEGKRLVLAADEGLLASLPKGEWIGGTIPYFMTEEGGKVAKDRLFVDELPAFVSSIGIKTYDEHELPHIAADSPDNGFSVVILPAFSTVHQKYAQNAPTYDGLFMKSIVGWVSGLHLSDLGNVTPKVFAGPSGESSGVKAIVMHVGLPKEYRSRISVVNIFEQGSGDEVSFPVEGFQAKECLINGQKANLFDYLGEKKIDIKLPLVADFCGTLVNVSIAGLEEKDKLVKFYAPVFEGVAYRFAKPVANYAEEFSMAVPKIPGRPAFACNCILNFLYGELEGKKTSVITGPMTFGEIAFQLLNQTMVYLEIDKVV